MQTPSDYPAAAPSLIARETDSNEQGRKRLRRLLEWRPLVVGGVFSYNLYLLHAPALELVWRYGLDPLGFSVFTDAGPAAILVARPVVSVHDVALAGPA